MSVQTIWKCALCQTQTTRSDTRPPDSWNHISVRVPDPSRPDATWGTNVEADFCKECSIMLANCETETGFFDRMKQRLGLK